jgi:hypothetical protein
MSYHSFSVILIGHISIVRNSSCTVCYIPTPYPVTVDRNLVSVYPISDWWKEESEYPGCELFSVIVHRYLELAIFVLYPILYYIKNIIWLFSFRLSGCYFSVGAIKIANDVIPLNEITERKWAKDTNYAISVEWFMTNRLYSYLCLTLRDVKTRPV